MLETVFGLGSSAALLGWVALVVAPRWRGLSQAAASVLIPCVLALAYLVLIMLAWSGAEGGFGSIADVQALFRSPAILVAGWLHYLAFDLFIGAWMVRRAAAERIPHAFVVPLLLLTFMFGPIGFLTFQVLRGVRRLAARRSGRWGWLAAREPALVAAGLLFWAALLPTGIALAIDPRTLVGVPIWLKPLKFELSLGLYALTLAILMPMASAAFRRSLAGRFVVWGTILPSMLELAYIGWRASRGEASHFNIASPAAALGYMMMGVGAVTLTLASPVLAWGVARRDAPAADPALRLAVILGLVMTFVLGGFEGMFLSGHLGHSVGVPPAGAASVPLFGWSRAVGDLRVAHFLGLHSQQLIPLAGVLAAWAFGARARGVVIGVAAAYAAVVVAAFLQALAGQPLIPL